MGNDELSRGDLGAKIRISEKEHRELSFENTRVDKF